MCGFLDNLLGGRDEQPQAVAPAPAVVREAPKVDAAVAETEAVQKTATEKLNTQRRRRSLSLLASGAGGDTSAPLTGKPTASAGKPTLGA